MDAVQNVVTRALPNLEEPSLLAAVLGCLQECGVETVEDLSLVEEKDLLSCLKPIQIRKLLKAVRGESTELYYLLLKF